MGWVKSKMLRCQESLAKKRAFLHGDWRYTSSCGKEACKRVEEGEGHLKLQDFSLKLNRRKIVILNPLWGSTTLLLSLGGSQACKKEAGLKQERAFKVARLHLWSWTAVTACCLKPGKSSNFKALLFPHILGSMEREYEIHDKFLAVHLYALTLLINWFGEVMVKQCWSNVGQMEEKLDFIISRVVRASPRPLDTASLPHHSVFSQYPVFSQLVFSLSLV